MLQLFVVALRSLTSSGSANQMLSAETPLRMQAPADMQSGSTCNHMHIQHACHRYRHHLPLPSSSSYVPSSPPNSGPLYSCYSIYHGRYMSIACV